MRLDPKPFESIKSGNKTIELRLYDEKRQLINIGDTIVFSDTQNESNVIYTRVFNIHRFDSFAELYKALPLEKCGYAENEIHTAKPEDMEAYYSKEMQEKYGVVGIDLRVIDNNNLTVNFYDSVSDEKLKFAVIIAKTNGKWVFCKHKERDTYEVAGGHREAGEDILTAQSVSLMRRQVRLTLR